MVSASGWTIIWQFPNGRKVDTTYLCLNNLAEKDSGTYWCIATKDGARLRLSFRIAFTSEQQTRYTDVETVDVIIAPRLEENLVIGGSIHRSCRVSTNGTWQVMWLDPRGQVIVGNNLDLNGVQAAQLGRYKCVVKAASNGEEVIRQMLITNPSKIRLDVLSLTIQKLPTEQLRMGGMIQRRCVAPRGWNVHWTLQSGITQAGDTLQITNLSPANAGAYICVAEGPNQQILRSTFRVTLIEDDSSKYTTVRIKSLDGESLIIGGSVRRDCVVSSPSWDIHWMKPDGQRVNGRLLSINNLQTRDSGRYECIAKDRNSDKRLVAWFSFRLQETRLETAEINVRTLPGERLETGGTLLRRCVVSQSGWNVYWTRPDGTTVNSDTLTINQLTPSHSGRYICHARKAATDSRISSWFSVTIHAANGRSYTNVDVNPLPGENLVVGGTIRRECVVTSPNWSVYWIKPNGGRIDSRFLTINDLQLSHSGRYTCFAENQSTQQKLNTRFTVNVAQRSGAHIRIENLPGESLQAGGSVRKRCVSSQPGWTIFWLLPNGGRVNDPQLIINNLNTSNSGRYTCRGEKGGLNMETWFSFQIVQVATIHMDTMPDERLQLGGVLSQRCRMTIQGWRIRWELPNGSTVLTDHLRITNLSQRHYGKYWCIATNPQTGETQRAWYTLSN